MALDRRAHPGPGGARRGAAATLVNALLREAGALPQLVKHDGWDYHLHATSADAPLADRMAVDAGMAFTDVIRTGQLDRLRRCAADDCTGTGRPRQPRA